MALTNNQDKFIIPTEENEIPMEELDGFNLSFDKIKIPAGGTTAFEVPSDDPDNPDIVKELKVIIVDQYAVNAYYKDAYDGTEVAPDCFSNDGHKGINQYGEICNCDTCPNNRYGSAIDGLGKAKYWVGKISTNFKEKTNYNLVLGTLNIKLISIIFFLLIILPQLQRS